MVGKRWRKGSKKMMKSPDVAKMVGERKWEEMLRKWKEEMVEGFIQIIEEVREDRKGKVRGEKS